MPEEGERELGLVPNPGQTSAQRRGDAVEVVGAEVGELLSLDVAPD